ncbi:MAG TPA: M20/M25/M40 family metallo-hydrolase, partial [Gammaproteobacteria bacterium]|nr:M20/M25/M40 family metallo-hydrolase [Gammaproteobacteria bacterium]
AVFEETGAYPQLSTGGGTSDGRFIAPSGAEVIELGLCHETAHQANEQSSLADLQKLPQLYENIIRKLLI